LRSLTVAVVMIVRTPASDFVTTHEKLDVAALNEARRQLALKGLSDETWNWVAKVCSVTASTSMNVGRATERCCVASIVPTRTRTATTNTVTLQRMLAGNVRRNFHRKRVGSWVATQER